MLPPAPRATVKGKPVPKRPIVTPVDPKNIVARQAQTPVHPQISFSFKFMQLKDLGDNRSLAKEIMVFGAMRVRSNQEVANLAALKLKVDIESVDNCLFVYLKDRTVKYYVDTLSTTEGMQPLQVVEMLKLHVKRPPRVTTLVELVFGRGRQDRRLKVTFQVAPIIRGKAGGVSFIKFGCTRARLPQ